MGLNKEDNKYPIVSIQCDWDETLMTPGNEVWASYKFKDCPSVHGKVTCVSDGQGRLKYESSEGFSVKLLNQSALEVVLPLIQHRAVLLAPTSSHASVHSKGITCFDVTSKGMVVSASTDGKLMLWNSDKEGRKVELQLEGHQGEVYRCKFFPSEKVILSCGNDLTLRIWCAITGKCPVKLSGHTQPVMDCRVVEQGRNIVSVSKDGSAKLWNCGGAECLGDIIKVQSIINCCEVQEAPSSLNLGMPCHTLDAKEVGTENKILLVGCEDGMVHCAGLQTRNHLFSVSCDSAVNSLAFISQTRFVVGCQDGKILGYDIVDRRAEMVFSWHDSNSAVLCIIAADDENRNVLVSRADGSVSVRPAGSASAALYLTGSNCDPVYHMAVNSRYLHTSCRDSVIRTYDRNLINKILNNNL